MRWKYLPILTIYFANYFFGFRQIAEMFWIKNYLSLTASEVVSITIWATVPWSVKILLGQIIGSVRIFGSARYVYVIIAALIMLLGSALTVAIAHQVKVVIDFASYYHLLIISGLLINTGIVLQDLVADTLCYEVVDKHDAKGKKRAEELVRQEVGNVQILARVTEMIGAMCALFVSGLVATRYSYADISWFAITVPFVSIIGLAFARKEPETVKEPIQLPILLGGSFYVLMIILIVLSGVSYSQELIFLIGVSVVCFSLYWICRDVGKKQVRDIISIIIVMFAYRLVPTTYSPGIEWWQIDILGFSPDFFARLAQVNTFLGFIGVWFLAKKIVNRQIGFIIFWLNIIHVILQLPMIGMSFGLHHWTMEHFGLGAREIALVDTVAEGPFHKLAFLSLCTAATYYAPKKHVATWFALVMSLMSLSYLQGSSLIKRLLSDVFVIERGVYANVSMQMIVTTSINILLPTIVILVFANPFSRKGK